VHAITSARHGLICRLQNNRSPCGGAAKKPKHPERERRNAAVLATPYLRAPAAAISVGRSSASFGGGLRTASVKDFIIGGGIRVVSPRATWTESSSIQQSPCGARSLQAPSEPLVHDLPDASREPFACGARRARTDFSMSARCRFDGPRWILHALSRWPTVRTTGGTQPLFGSSSRAPSSPRTGAPSRRGRPC